MAGEGFEPSKAVPTRLQRVPFDRSGTPPGGASVAIRPRESRSAGAPTRPHTRRILARRARSPSCPRPPPPFGSGWILGGVAEPLRLGQRLELLQRVVLDLADALARDVEGT